LSCHVVDALLLKHPEPQFPPESAPPCCDSLPYLEDLRLLLLMFGLLLVISREGLAQMDMIPDTGGMFYFNLDLLVGI